MTLFTEVRILDVLIRQQEVKQRLLRAEYDRKSEELEEARLFQLSLLPKELPRHPTFELSVYMKTATEVGEIQARTGEDVVACFVPTTPNPTSGFIILVPKQDVVELDMEVEEAVKLVMSLGVVVPTWTPKEAQELPLKMPENGS